MDGVEPTASSARAVSQEISVHQRSASASTTSHTVGNSNNSNNNKNSNNSNNNKNSNNSNNNKNSNNSNNDDEARQPSAASSKGKERARTPISDPGGESLMELYSG